MPAHCVWLKLVGHRLHLEGASCCVRGHHGLRSDPLQSLQVVFLEQLFVKEGFTLQVEARRLEPMVRQVTNFCILDAADLGQSLLLLLDRGAIGRSVISHFLQLCLGDAGDGHTRCFLVTVSV